MKIVITIIGHDCVGIVAMASGTLAENNVNILDMNQNIMSGFFNMVMIADLDGAKVSLTELQEIFKVKGEAMGLQIKVQHEDIFNAMHRI